MTAYAYTFGVSKEDCAEYLLHALYTSPSGATRYDNHGDDLNGKRVYHGDKEREAVWKHTVEETKDRFS